PEGVEAVKEIAATPGLDGLFVGPADLAVSYGETDLNHPKVRAAMGVVGAAAAENGKAAVTFAPSVESTKALRELGITMFFFASEHAWMLQGARATASAFREQAG
ncbi:MAG: aldolase, partial [Rhodobacteraceae bacterium]|nr:aldolase [Paracoccaceae bacterium]